MSTIAAPAASYEARPAVFVECDVASSSPVPRPSSHGESVRPVQPIRRSGHTPQPNDRCPCGSGKKVKRCCGDAAPMSTADAQSGSAACCAERLRLSESASPIFSGEAAPRQHTAQAPSRGAASLEKKVDEGAPRTDGHSPSAQQAAEPQNNAASAHPSGDATVPIENPKSEIENGEPVPCSPPPALSPLAAEGTGCAAWMRLTGLYPWKPLSLTERRESLDRLIRHAHRWFAIRKASGAFRPLISGTGFPVRPEIGGAGVRSAEFAASPARQGETHTSNACAPSALADKNVRHPETASAPSPLGEAAAVKIENPKSEIENDLDAQLFETLRDAVTIAEPSYELAGELEISEAKLNQLCRERSGLSAREWWDVSRAQDALKLIRAEIESALDGAVLDRRSQIRKRGVQLEDLHRALRQHRRAQASTAAERAYTLGFRTPARLNWALWVATRKTMQQHEAEILKEIFQTWSYNHHSCSLIAKNAEGEFKPQYEEPNHNYPSNPPINTSQHHKKTTLPGPSQAPTPAHAHAA